MTKILITLCAMVLLTLAGCKSGYNKRYTSDSDSDVETPDCTQTAANENLISEGESLYNLLANLTCNEADKDGALMGQSLGSGNELVAASDDDGFEEGKDLYATLLDSDVFNSRLPSIISIDYEFSKEFETVELEAANTQLKAHWDDGGIVMISWSPLNPWRDISGCSDQQLNTDSTPSVESLVSDIRFCDEVDLSELSDTDGDMRDEWLEQLDKVASLLQYFMDEKIPVLWAPMPAPNNAAYYWWGIEANPDSNSNDDEDNADDYIALWQDMYTYLTDEKDLDNLIWVYSPAKSGSLPEGAKVAWAYPGDEYVDVVAGIEQNDNLNIADYVALNSLGKPLGMMRYNASPSEDGGLYSGNGSFDNLLYADRLEGSYENVSFWVTGHSYSYDESGTTYDTKFALVDNTDAQALANRSYVLDLKTVNDNSLR